jgi:hypothetical protein
MGHGAGRLRSPAAYLVSRVQPPRTAVRPCTVEAVALGEGTGARETVMVTATYIFPGGADAMTVGSEVSNE